MALSKEEMIFQQMTDNIDKPFPIVINKSNSLSFKGTLMQTWKFPIRSNSYQDKTLKISHS